MLRSHQLEKAPVDLHAIITESLALVAHDILDVVSLLLMQVYYSHSSRIP